MQLWLSRDGLQLGYTDFEQGRFLMTTSPRRGWNPDGIFN
jgi:hypothetical protein